MNRPVTTASPLSTRWTRIAAGSVLLVGAALAATTALNAQAQATAPAAATASGAQPMPRMHGMHDMKGMHGHRMGGMGMGMFMHERGLDRMLDEVKASDAQRAKIRQIAGAARDDLRKLHDNAPNLHQQALDLMSKPQVDAAGAEKLRQQMVARHDAVSKRSLTAMLDIARVLTPEQRATIADKLRQHDARRQERQGHGGHGGHGHHGGHMR